MEPVLLIEGHALLRHALKDLLAQSGFHAVIEATDPIEAISHVLRVSPRIIILDTTWTEINGQLLGKILRQIVPQSKIVLLVDESWLADGETAHFDQTDAFVPKNCLTKALSSVLAQWQLADLDLSKNQGL